MTNNIEGVEIKGTLDGKQLDAAITINRSAAELLNRVVEGVSDSTISLTRAASPATDDLSLWVVIRKATDAISFANYDRFLEVVLCGSTANQAGVKTDQALWDRLKKIRPLPYNDTDAYRLLKAATEAFLLVNCGVSSFLDSKGLPTFTAADAADLNRRVNPIPAATDADLLKDWTDYTGNDGIIPYLDLILGKIPDVRIFNDSADRFGFLDSFRGTNTGAAGENPCRAIIQSKLTQPCFLELIWSYWMEEAALVQTMNAISLRFQNVRGRGGRDPLAMVEIDPLRPVNNLLWGYIQDEQHRLSLVRRVYEYDHHYGIAPQGKAIPQLRPADSRSKFIESFHNLLYLCSVFYKEDDDTTVLADGFPLLNALKEVHLELSKGAHNQFGDLPWTARIEMLMQQWLLARPEFREFLPTRLMVAYPEPWMDRVEAMKTLQGWTDTSVIHFYNLAVFGEKLLLSIRFGAWSAVNDRDQAANWARYWRSEAHGYMHAYRAATGVDLTAETSTQQQSAARVLQPATLLRQRADSLRNRQLARSSQRA